MRSLDSRHRMQVRNSIFSKIVIAFIAIVFIGIIGCFGFGIWASIQVLDIIKEEGLKSVINTVWEGSK